MREHRIEPGIASSISAELIRISELIEKVPLSKMAALDEQDIENIQQIDICSQKLKALSKILNAVFVDEDGALDQRLHELLENSNMEYVGRVLNV